VTTEQKIKYIQSFYKLIVESKTFREASSHSAFTRGILAAWHADMSVSSAQYRSMCEDIEVVMQVKRNLTVRGM
jgi:hypothetical protein